MKIVSKENFIPLSNYNIMDKNDAAELADPYSLAGLKEDMKPKL